jgi:phosphate transport system substrate-binding protein
MRELCEAASTERPGHAAVQAPPAHAPIIAGSGTGLLVASSLVEAFGRTHPRDPISLHGGIGSAATLRAVADGLVAVGFVSRALRGPEKAWGVTILPYARTPIVCGAHPTVPEDDITASDLVRICQGARTHWCDGRTIVLLTREPGAGSIEALEQAVPGFTAAYQASRQAKRVTTLYSDPEMNRVLARTPGGLGFTDLGTLLDLQLPIKVLRFNGALPTLANIRSGAYSLVKTLAFAFVEERLPDSAIAFLKFVRSKDGEKILRARGCLPATEGRPSPAGMGRGLPVESGRQLGGESA